MEKLEKEQRIFYSFVKDFLAGGIASVGAKTLFAPVDRVKLLLQTQAINTDLKTRYKNPIDCIVRVYREQGLFSFWRGNLANVYRYFPNQALNFSFKDRYKKMIFSDALMNLSFLSQNHKLWLGNLLAGGLAGGTSLFITFPFELARTRLATDIGNEHKHIPRRFKGTFDCFVKTYRNEGITGLYSGLGIALFGVVIFKALYMGGYDSLKQSMELEKSSVMVRLIAAQFITTTVGTACYPIDTIKRRLMIQQGLSAEVKAADSSSPSTIIKQQVQRKYKNAIDCFVKIIKEEGVRGLFSGLSVNIIRGVSGALLLVGYDEMKELLRDR